MIEIELFYKIVESEIRRKHIKYLKRQKCLPSDQTDLVEQTENESEQVSTSTVSAADDFVYADKPSKREKAKRVKAFNKGIEIALKVLISEYKDFNNRLKKEEEGKKKF